MTKPLHITVIAEEPAADQAKTELVPPLSNEQAAQIAAASLHDTFAAVSAVCAAHDDVRPIALIDGVAGAWVPPNTKCITSVGTAWASDLPTASLTLAQA